MNRLSAFIMLSVLASGEVAASARETGVMIPASGPCFAGVLNFARDRIIEVWRGVYVDEDESDEDDLINCTIGPCGGALFLRSTRNESVEQQIQDYLTSEQARRDRRSTHLDKSPDCFSRRTVFEALER